MKPRRPMPGGRDDLPGVLGKGTWSVLDLIGECLATSADTFSTEDREEIGARLSRGVHRLFRTDKVWFALPEEEGGGFRLRSFPSRLRRGGKGIRISGSREHPFGWVAGEGRPLWRNDLGTDLRFPPPEGRRERGSEILVPLLREKKCWGVLGLRVRRPYAFRLEDARALERFADLAGLALERRERFREIRQQALLDGLTGVINRGGFEQFLVREADRCRRFQRNMSVLLIDLDDFKQVNDIYGHAEGDRVLKGVVRIVRQGIRRLDLLARYGGEEFALLLPETPEAGGERTGEKIRRAVAAARLLRKPRTVHRKVTLSIGVAGFPDAAGDIEGLLKAADRALYEAKSTGKNRVVRSAAAG